MGYWWRFTYRYGRRLFFHTEISISICWIYVSRIRHRFGDNCPNFDQKRLKIKFKIICDAIV